MFIIESKNYKRDYKKKIFGKNLSNEINRIEDIQKIIVASENLQVLMNSPYKNMYGIEQKKGNMKELYTAKVNKKVRLVMKPVGNYPYNLIEIQELEFTSIDDKHYGEG